MSKYVYTDDEHGKIELKYKKLGLTMGDLVAVKHRAGIPTEALDELVRNLGDVGLGNVVVVMVKKLTDIRKLSEEQMNLYGWYRRDSEGQEHTSA